MTAVMPRRPATAPATGGPSAANCSDSVRLHTWVLSVQDWRVHALADPCSEAWGVQATRCGVWHPMGCPVTVARRGEVCPRCAAGGTQRLELLPDRTGGRQGTAAR